MLDDILRAFGLDATKYTTEKFGNGLINSTWRVTNNAGADEFVLQQINKAVFKDPYAIAQNIRKIDQYLSQQFPGYLFVPALPALNGDYLVKYTDNQYYRLMPYVKDSVSLDTVQTPREAFEAARQFARFTAQLSEFDVNGLKYTLPDFHHLSARYTQFLRAVQGASNARLTDAADAITKARLYQDIALQHQSIISEALLPLRVIHHDTKISNILFDQQHKGLCVIDLDTVMPGYYISDVGDMMRTYLSPANEEEQDLSLVEVREDLFAAIVKGYFMEMGAVLTDTEKNMFVYAGKFMIYMQALRFLTDYLNNDIYYGAQYPQHNLTRAKNQFILLEKYIAAEVSFQEIVAAYNQELAG